MDATILHDLFEYRDGKLYRKKTTGSAGLIGSEAGYIRKDGYSVVQVNHKLLKTHRVIFLMSYGYLPAEIDHINGNKSDNRIENLRGCNKIQNQHNAKIRKDSKCGVKGVTWKKSMKKWCARVQTNGKRVHVGYFSDIQDAENAVRLYRIEHHGTFARHE